MTIQEKWDFHYQTAEDHELYPYRQILTYSVILESDELGNRLGSIDTDLLRHRVLDTPNQYALLRSHLEQDGIFSKLNESIITEEHYPEVYNLVNGRYSIHKAILDGVNGHNIDKLLHSTRHTSPEDLANLLASAFLKYMGMVPEKIDASTFVARSESWSVWVEILTAPTVIKNANPMARALRRILDGTRELNAKPYYLMCGPAFSGHFAEQGAGVISLIWSLSLIRLIKGLGELAKTYPPLEIQLCFPEFFRNQGDRVALSTSVGFAQMEEQLRG